jgi:T5SS/PEP-CTERM-associated repeat protein
MQGFQQERQTLQGARAHPPRRATLLARSRHGRQLHAASAVAVAVNLALAAWPATAVVVSSGDVSPPIASAPSVDLTGQRIFLGFTNGGVGTLGTLTVNGGSSLTAAQIVPGTGGFGTGIVTVTGAGSIINLTGGGAFNGLDIGSWGTGTLTVSSGGQIVCSSPLACPFNGIGNAAGSTGTLAINAGSVSGLGTLVVGQGTLQPGFGTTGAATTGNLNITNGGTLATTGSSAVASNSGQTGVVTGNVTISGAGSAWTITRDLANGGAQANLNLAQTANSTANMTISNGGNLTIVGSRSNPATDNSIPFLTLSNVAGATSTLNVTTGGSVVLSGDTGGISVGGSFSGTGGNGTLNITGGGTVSGTGTNGLLYVVIGRNQGTGTLNVSGTGSKLVVAGVGGANTQNLDGTGGLIQVGRNQGNGGGNGTLNVTSGGSVLVSDNGLAASTGSMGMQIASGTGSTGTVSVSGSGSSIVVSSTGGSATTPYVQIGAGGVGQMTISNGGSVSVLGTGQRNFVVGNSSTGSGTLDMTAGAQLNASWFAVGNNGGTGAATINSSTVNLDGTVFATVVNGDQIGAGVRVGRGEGSTGVLNLENGAAINLNNSIPQSNVVLGGTGTLVVSNQGTLTATILNVGRAEGGFGSLSVDNGTINLSGQQAAGTGAALTIGNRGGTGLATIANSQVSISNPGSGGASLNVGGTPTNPLGSGSLSVTNSQINVVAAPGLAVARIGHDGTGSATLNTSTLNVAGGSLIIAGTPGSSGNLTLNAGSVVNTAYVGIGASPSGQGGSGSLVINNSTINTTTFEVGALGVLSGNNAVINATGDVIVAGIISPGNSPGRININCNLITLPGSRLILDIETFADGFDVDHLIIGNDSTFSLSSLQVVFNFIGNADPVAFAASGGFDLDNFIQSLDPVTGAVTGLSSVFGPGRTWGDVIDSNGITVQSDVYNVSEITFGADGSFQVVAAPVPELSTWLMMVLGLLAVGAAARGRAPLAVQRRMSIA